MSADFLWTIFLPTYATSNLSKLTSASRDPGVTIQKMLSKREVTLDTWFRVREIYFPVHLSAGREGEVGHWVLAVWEPRSRQIRWFDSLGLGDSQARVLREFTEAVTMFWTYWVEGAGRELGVMKLTVKYAQCSQQAGGEDCGVYTLGTCLFRVFGYSRFKTGQRRDNLLRRYFAGIIVQDGWGGEFPWNIPSPLPLPNEFYKRAIAPSSNGYS